MVQSVCFHCWVCGELKPGQLWLRIAGLLIINFSPASPANKNRAGNHSVNLQRCNPTSIYHNHHAQIIAHNISGLLYINDSVQPEKFEWTELTAFNFVMKNVKTVLYLQQQSSDRTWQRQGSSTKTNLFGFNNINTKNWNYSFHL